MLEPKIGEQQLEYIIDMKKEENNKGVALCVKINREN